MWMQNDVACSPMHACDLKTSPWQAVRLYRLARTQLKQEDEPAEPIVQAGDLPDFIAYLADGTANYEAEIRQAWEAYKLNPTHEKAQEFINYLIQISGAMWPEVMAAVLGIGVEELSEDQRRVLTDALDEHHGYMRESLLPDITRYQQLGELDKLDYRTIVLYAGALWAFGNLATVMFDGTKLRDLADLFMFAGPNDEETCTGPRGCKTHANKIYTVAQILAEMIIPGRMRCLTNCRHFLLPIASPLKGTEKHQAGRHDQRTHTPEKYRGQGQVPEKPGPKPYVPERVRELSDPESETNQQAAKDWKNLSHAERMKLADPDAMDRAMAENLRRYREEVEIPHKLKGQKLTSKTYDQVAENAQARIDALQSALTPVTEAQLREYVDTHVRKAVDQGIKDKSLKMDAGQLDDMLAKNVDKLAHQEIEARKRQLGDHGIRHAVGNMRAVNTMLDDPDLPATSGLQRMMALQTMVDHDMGYTVGVVAASIPATSYHPQYSEKYAKAQGYDKLFGVGNAKEMARMVREHAHVELDWDDDTLMSVVRTADNTALFNREKLPALFYDVPGATDELYKLQLAVAGGTAKEATPTVKENLRKLVTDSTIDDRHKAELMMAVDEVSPYTGKFTLGMASGEIEGYDYKPEGVMNIKVKGKPERELLTGLFDLGDRQFNKFVEDYDTTGTPATGLELSKGGKKVIRIDYEEPAERKVSGTLATMFENSVRPDIRLAARQAGPGSTLSDRERAWPMIQANVKGKLNAAEMAEFERRFKNDTLDEMPLTERERSYLESKLKEMLKHLPGRHDQSTHNPYKGAIGSGPTRRFDYSKFWSDQELVTVFHGTAVRKLESIQRQGLIPSLGGYTEGRTFVTTSPEQAWLYSAMGGEVEASGHATLEPEERVIVEFRVPPSYLKPNSYFLKHRDAYDEVRKEIQRDPEFELEVMGEFEAGAIPSEYIVGVFGMSEQTKLKHLPGRHDQSTHTPKKYGAGAVSDAVGKLSLLPPGADAGTVENPLGMPDDYGFVIMIGMAEPPKQELDIVIQDVVGGVDDLHAGTIEKYIREGSDERATVVRYRGVNYVLDGNHKMAAAKLLGERTYPANVYDVDATGIRSEDIEYKHQAGRHDQSTHNPYKGKGGVTAAATFPLHGETVQLTKAGMVTPEMLPPPREGHIRLYHTTARSEHLATIEVEGLATEYSTGYEAPTEFIWATGGPDDYSKARGLVAFDVPADRAEKVNVTDYMIRGDIPPENVVATYPMVTWGRGETKRWDHIIDTTQQFGKDRVAQAVYEDVKPLILQIKHLPGRHDQRSHGYRYGAGVTMSHLRRQRATMTEEQWEDYKARARARRAQLAGKPVTQAMLQKTPYGGWGEYREDTDDHFLLMMTQRADMHEHSIRPDQFNPERERELALDTLDETRRVLKDYPDLVKRMDEDGAYMTANADAKMGMNVVFTVDDQYSGAGSGGPGSAKVFWTPYTAQGVPRYQNDYYNNTLGVDPMYVAAHEFHHGFGSNTELDTFSTAMGLHMHYKHGNTYIPKAVKYETESLLIHANWRAHGKFKRTALESRAAVKFLYKEHPEEIDRVIDDYWGEYQTDRAAKMRKRIASW